MSQITIQLSADSPADLTRLLEGLLQEWSPRAREQIANIAYTGEGATDLTMTTSTGNTTTEPAEPPAKKSRGRKAAAAPEEAKAAPDGEPKEEAKEPAGDIAQGKLSPAKAREEGIRALQIYFGQNPGNMDVITRLQTKYGVKLFAEISDEQASAFHADALLVAAGNTEIAA